MSKQQCTNCSPPGPGLRDIDDEIQDHHEEKDDFVHRFASRDVYKSVDNLTFGQGPIESENRGHRRSELGELSGSMIPFVTLRSPMLRLTGT